MCAPYTTEPEPKPEGPRVITAPTPASLRLVKLSLPDTGSEEERARLAALKPWTRTDSQEEFPEEWRPQQSWGTRFTPEQITDNARQVGKVYRLRNFEFSLCPEPLAISCRVEDLMVYWHDVLAMQVWKDHGIEY